MTVRRQTPMALPWRPGLFAIMVSILIVALDQATKAAVLRFMVLHESIPIIPSVSLTYTRNPGAAFSLLADADPTFRGWFFVVVSLVALALVIIFLRRVEHGDWWTLTALSLILGGAIGNLIDRVRHGEVIDFIDLYVGQYHWPIFNIADSGITIGMLILVGHALLHRRADVRTAADS